MAGQKKMKRMVLFAKTQTAIDTDPIPTAGANAILCRALKPKPVKAEFVERNNIIGVKGTQGSLSVAVHREIEFEFEMAGSGAAGTAPKWGPILKSCEYSETVTASTSVVYQPVTTGAPFLTLYCYLDGLRFKMLNSLGTVSFEMNAKGIPIAKCKFVGEYSPVTDTTYPTGIDFTGFIKPKTVGKLNSTFTLFGVSAPMQSFSIDMANQIGWRELVGYAGANIPDRKPTCSATIELTDVATYDWAGAVVANTEGAVQMVHGTTAGNIITLAGPKAQFSGEPDITESDGIAMLTTQFSLNMDAGNDELVITLT